MEVIRCPVGVALGRAFHLVCSCRSAPSGSGRRVDRGCGIYAVLCNTTPPRRGRGNVCYDRAPSAIRNNRQPLKFFAEN